MMADSDWRMIDTEAEFKALTKKYADTHGKLEGNLFMDNYTFYDFNRTTEADGKLGSSERAYASAVANIAVAYPGETEKYSVRRGIPEFEI